nr:ribonuclease H-like domain-containing protein [Tanacetum cinerariifolium]GEZ13871.1 ribonuclease H-like domain-containing protein [Tanacetum cinerariifolium]
MWRLRIKQYFQIQDYALWDVIENGNSFKPVAETTTDDAGTSTTVIPGPVTIEEKAKKKNYVKARSMLLMALANKHLMTFNMYKDAKTLLQKLVSQLAVLGVFFSQEDLNLMFLRSLPSEWNTHMVVWRNKLDLDTMSLNDLYSNFKIVEQEVRGTTSTNTSSQNMAFVSSPSPNSTNEVPADFGVCTASPPVSTANLIDATVTKNQETTRRIMNMEDTSSKAMVAIDGASFCWSYMANDEAPTNMAFMALSGLELIGSQVTDNIKKGVGYVSYNVVAPSHTRRFSPIRIDLSHTGLPEFAEPSVQSYGVKPIEVESDEEDEVESPPEKERKIVAHSKDKVEVE